MIFALIMGSEIETPNYTLLEKKGLFEIRIYDPDGYHRKNVCKQFLV